jgi:octaprenyl-diphosphate synthase
MQLARAVVADEFEAVNQLIIEQLHSNVPLAENIGHYIVDAGGKRLRPLLTLLAAGACGKLSAKHYTLAAVIEFIHTATLLHDDVVDLSELRRGRPTANAAWDNASSVLVGDFLYTRAFQLLVSLNTMPIMELMANTTNIIAEGEVLQLTKAGDASTDEAAYFEVIKNKTAVLFAAATRGAAMLADCSDDVAEALYQYGLNLGLAFQLIDDALDYEGSAEEMGKNVGDDLSEGKPTLPLIYAMQHASAEDAELIRQAINHKSAEHIERVTAIVMHCGALQYTHDKAAAHQKLACNALASLPESKYREGLLEIAELAVKRRN